LGRKTVKITADTNVLVRAIADDDPHQSPVAQSELENSDMVALVLPALCELVWVLSKGYKIPLPDIVEAIRRQVNAVNAAVNHPAVASGLAMLEAGGDFADGIIAHEGRWLGADAFVSFDRQAVMLTKTRGDAAACSCSSHVFRMRQHRRVPGPRGNRSPPAGARKSSDRSVPLTVS
jgi:predicted nucleic-acid-binding protein